MSTTTRTAGGLALLLLTAVPATAAPSSAPTALAGYRAAGAASPLSVLYDDTSIAVPRKPGDPLLEISQGYSQTLLETGPNARALSSSVWPGAFVANVAPLVVPGAPAYPVSAEATTGGQQAASAGADPGVVMRAEAKGARALATARAGQGPDTGQAEYGSLSSTSVNELVGGEVRSRVQAVASGVVLLQGLVRVDQVVTTLTARSDGRARSSTGATTVSGLTVLGVGYVVDEKGLRPTGGPAPAGVPDTPRELREAGIHIEPVTQSETVDGTSVGRQASGLRITVESTKVREVLSGLPIGTVVELLEPLPPVVRDPVLGQLFGILALSPKTTYVLGRGSLQAAGTLPLPAVPVPAVPAVPATTDTGDLATEVLRPTSSGATSDAPAGTDVPSGLDLAAVPPTDAAEPGPELAADVVLDEVGAAPALPVDAFAGVGLPLLLAGLLLAGLGGKGLDLLRTLALAPPAVRGCAYGAPDGITDIREK